MVGGVSPGKGGQVHLGLPVFNSVQEVCRLMKLCYILFSAPSLAYIHVTILVVINIYLTCHVEHILQTTQLY